MTDNNEMNLIPEQLLSALLRLRLSELDKPEAIPTVTCNFEVKEPIKAGTPVYVCDMPNVEVSEVQNILGLAMEDSTPIGGGFHVVKVIQQGSVSISSQDLPPMYFKGDTDE